MFGFIEAIGVYGVLRKIQEKVSFLVCIDLFRLLEFMGVLRKIQESDFVLCVLW